MAKEVTFTNGVKKTYSNLDQQLYVCGDPVRNTWCRKKVSELLVGDKVAHEHKKPEGPTLEVSALADV